MKIKHFTDGAWRDFQKQGCKLTIYLPYHKEQYRSAAEFLREAIEMYASFRDMEDDFCVIAKIALPEQQCSVSLQMDRDYFYVNKRNADEADTLACWQGSNALERYSINELWTNMVSMGIGKKKAQAGRRGVK